MATNFDNPSKVRRGYHEFGFEGETGIPMAPVEEDTSDAVDVGLTTMMSCVNILIKARRDRKIDFAPGVTATMLETMGVLLMRAAHTRNSEREAVFHHWLKDGPQRIDKLIAKVEARQGKILMPEDLASMFMGKPPGY